MREMIWPLVFLCAAGCGSSGGTTPRPDGGHRSGGNVDTGIRVVNMDPDFDSPDYCISTDDGATWDGPVQAYLSGSNTPNYPTTAHVTGYYGYAGGKPLKVRLISVQATDCNTGTLPDVSSGSSIVLIGDYSSVVVFKTGAMTSAAVLLADKPLGTTGKGTARYFNASFDRQSEWVNVPPMKALFASADLGHFSTISDIGTIDVGTGFLTTTPGVISGATLEGPMSSDSTDLKDLTLEDGKVRSLFSYGRIGFEDCPDDPLLLTPSNATFSNLVVACRDGSR